MLVLIDSEKQLFNLYTNDGLKQFKMNDQNFIQCLSPHLNSTVYYITSAVEAEPSAIYDMLSSLGINTQSRLTPQSHTGNNANISGKKYLRSTSKKMIVVPNTAAITKEEKKEPLLTFNNDHHCIVYDEDFVNKHELLHRMIKNGMLQIINEQEYHYHMSEYNKMVRKKFEDQKDRSSSVLVDSVESALANADSFGDTNLTDLISAEGEAEGSDDPNPAISEEQRLINQLGIR